MNGFKYKPVIIMLMSFASILMLTFILKTHFHKGLFSSNLTLFERFVCVQKTSNNMVPEAITFLTNYLNQQLKSSFQLHTEPVVAGRLNTSDGTSNVAIEDRIVISLINLEQEASMKQATDYTTRDGHPGNKIEAPISLNLYLLISGNYNSNYMEALKMLSEVIRLLHNTPLFTNQEFPEMPKPLAKLTLENINIPLAELGHIWSGMGVKYVPSIVYRMRVITMHENTIQKELPDIQNSNNETPL